MSTGSAGTVRVDMRCPCRFSRREWQGWIRAMMRAAAEASMLPGQGFGPRGGDDTAGCAPEDLRVELVVAGDGDIAEVNARNLGCSGPTNILSFPGDGASLGTLFLSADTLEREYLRDKNQGINPKIPENYFPNDDDTKEPIISWRGHATLLFTNWLNYFVYQSTPYDIAKIKNSKHKKRFSRK